MTVNHLVPGSIPGAGATSKSFNHRFYKTLEKIKLKAEEYDEPNCSEGSGIYSGLIINK